jgi:Ser/Thr protein kinase RdoA (MazF antagonist)
MIQQQMKLTDTLTLLNQLAEQSLVLWDIPDDAVVSLINVSENATYLVKSSAGKSILRIHRENYHSERAIECELEWMNALSKDSDVLTPGVYLARDGKYIQSGIVEGLADPRFMALFQFVEGDQPDETKDLTADFEKLGEIAAKTHGHAINWKKPDNFERLIWDDSTMFGEEATWGDWRAAPNVTQEIKVVLEKLEILVRQRLAVIGKTENNFGLIHADMRLANLIIHETGPRLIDFDDCGFGWFLYDFATAISFIEDDPAIPYLKNAWVKGYRTVRPLSDSEVQEIDTFIMLRRLALLAWIGTHIEAPEPQEMAPHFARVTAELATDYIARYE